MCKTRLDYGFPTVMGRGLFGEFKNFVNPPFLIVTMPDLSEMFKHEFEGADYKIYLADSIEQVDLDRDAAGLKDIRAIIGLGGGQALDVAKYFAWRRNLPLFQAPTALSVNAVYSHRSGVRENGKVMDAIAGIGLDVRPQAMGLNWVQAEEGLTGMRSYVNSLPLWHSPAHDAAITPGFIADLKLRLDRTYGQRA